MSANLDAERTLLGQFLRWPDLLADIDLRPEECHAPGHRLILAALRSVYPQPVTLVTVGERLLAAGELEAAGGIPALAKLEDDVATQVGANHHARIIRRHAQRRALAQLGADLAAWGEDPDAEPAEVVGDVERRLLAITQSETAAGRLMPELVAAVWADLQRRAEGLQPGRRMGLAKLDEVTLGLRPSELIVLAARPGMGKSALAVAILRNVAAPDYHAAVFSLEMSGEALTHRMVAVEAQVNLRIVSGRLTGEALRRVQEALATIHDLPIHMFDGPRPTIDAIASQCRRLAARVPLGLVVIDHAGLVRGRGELRERMVDVSHEAKAIAKECRCTVLLLAQLNRKCEERSDKRPVLSDLKESGSLEEDADGVWFVYRDEYYNKESADAGIAEVIVAKQREGPTDTARLAYIAAYTKFASLTARGGGW